MTKAQDPPHGGSSVDKQLANKNTGFVQTYMDERGGPTEVHPGHVIGQPKWPDDLPVYDHLTVKFCVVIAGSPRSPARRSRSASMQWPDKPPANVTTTVRRSTTCPRFFGILDGVRGVSWANFVHDVTPLVWAVDNDYPFKHLLSEHVSWFGGHFRPPYFGDTFVQRAAAGRLPSVSWIEPSFADLHTGLMRIISPPSNDDHPPADVMLGQQLVLKIYDAIASSPNWSKTMLVITYDEHGGFFDHVPPPLNPPDDHPKVFNRYGVRVPAIVVSPLVGRRSFSHQIFDHTSIIKTILLRFARTGGTIPDMGKRVSNAQHLGVLVTEQTPRPPETPELYRPLAHKIDANRKDLTHDHLVLGATQRAAAKTQFTDLQHDYLTIQTQFMKQLVKEEPDRLTTFVP